MNRLLASEWRKVMTTKMMWVLAAVGLVYSGVNAITLTLLATGIIPGVPGDLGTMLMDPDYIATLLGQSASAATFVLVLGIIAMTSEYRHMTITSTFLATPRRGRVLTSKMVLYGLLGAAIAVVTVAAVTVTVIVTVSFFEHAPITAGAVGSVFIGALIGFTLYAILGVSLGALIRSQIAAIVIALVWIMLIETLVGLAFPVIAKWMPGGALNAAMAISVRSDATGGMAKADVLPPWGGALVLAAYAVVFAVIAARTTLRRDIT